MKVARRDQRTPRLVFRLRHPAGGDGPPGRATIEDEYAQ
jgi:hypothetical protein